MHNSIFASVDPFSKITITSDTATCKALKTSTENSPKKAPEKFALDYQKNVRVTFADQSSITSDTLHIDFDGSNHEAKGKILNNFKKITFTNNVCITNAQRTVTAQSADLFLETKKCILQGDVKIRQTKEKPSDIPVSIDSQRAEFSFTDKEILLSGSSSCPVSTTIILDGHPAMSYKKDLKKKKKKQ